MSAAVSTLPQLRTATLEDYDRIVRLEAANGLSSMPRDDWRRLWLTNPLWPLVSEDWPIGWVLENDRGELVGSLANIPSRYQFRGQELLCANGRGWVVDAGYRSFALALMGEYFGQSKIDVFVNTTVGLPAAPMISALSDRIPRGDAQTCPFFATAYRPLAAKALARMHVPMAGLLAYPVAAALRVRDAWRLRSLSAAPASVAFETIRKFDDRFDAFWAELARQKREVLLAVRDRQTLDWHFTASIRRGDLWILTATRNGLLRGYGILQRMNSTAGASRLRFVDFQSLEEGGDLLPTFLRMALRQCAIAGVQVLEHLGCGMPTMAAFDQHAPYRRKLECWPFYFRANDSKLAGELARPEAWEPSAYDGDASLD